MSIWMLLASGTTTSLPVYLLPVDYYGALPSMARFGDFDHHLNENIGDDVHNDIGTARDRPTTFDFVLFCEVSKSILAA
eukprot:gene318-548_t